MGYFPNGTSGEAYQDLWCLRCKNYGADQRSKDTDTESCPILDAHLMANYEQGEDSRASVALAAALGMLIPRDEENGDNGQCEMFRVRDHVDFSQPVLPVAVSRTDTRA